MRHAALGLATLLAMMPAPTAAVTLPNPAPAWCSADPGTVVHMPCDAHPQQLETLRLMLVNSLVPMNCRPVGVRFTIAGLPVQPGRAAGLIATALVHVPSRRAQIEEMCEPAHW